MRRNFIAPYEIFTWRSLVHDSALAPDAAVRTMVAAITAVPMDEDRPLPDTPGRGLALEGRP